MGKIKRNVLLIVIILHIPKTWNEPYCMKHQKLCSEHPNTKMLLSEGQNHKNGSQTGRYKSFKTCQCLDHQLTERKKISVDSAAVKQKAWKLLKLCNMAPKILTDAQETIKWVLRLKKHNFMFEANVQFILKTKATMQESCFCYPLNLRILKAFNLLNYTGN